MCAKVITYHWGKGQPSKAMMVKKKGMVVIGISSQKNWDSMENPGIAWEIPGKIGNQGKHLKSWEIPGYFSSYKYIVDRPKDCCNVSKLSYK